MHYLPLPREGLQRLKEELALTNSQMAEMFGIAAGGQFHKYTSDKERREMGFHVLMYGMLNLALMRGIPISSPEVLFDLARSYGAVIEPARDGERQP
jgi:hypothetical protein